MGTRHARLSSAAAAGWPSRCGTDQVRFTWHRPDTRDEPLPCPFARLQARPARPLTQSHADQQHLQPDTLLSEDAEASRSGMASALGLTARSAG